MHRRKLNGQIHALVSPRLEGLGYLAAFTERTGGASAGPFRSLNVAYHTGDRRDRVLENRRAVCDGLGVPPFAVGEQVHGRRIVRIGAARKEAGFKDRAGSIPGVDALSVARPGIPVAVLVADCLPIALASAENGLAVAVHAGWKGLAAGILPGTIGSFGHPGSIDAAIGPAIGPCHYEVSPDVALAVAAGSEVGAVTKRRGGKLYLDLEATAIRTLRALGVRRVERSGICTFCEKDRFFSYRRDGRTGRQALILMRL